MPTGSVSKEDMFGSDDIGKLCAKYDKDGNGQFDIDEVRQIVLDCMKERNSKKAYKRASIGLFAIVIMALVAMFGVSFAAGLSLKDQAVEEHGGSAELTTLSGNPITVSQTTTASGLYTLPTFTISRLTSIQTITGYVDMTDDANIGEWVPYAAKVSAAYKKGDEVAYLKTFSGDRFKVTTTNAILTIDGVERAFASNVPPGASGRRLEEDIEGVVNSEREEREIRYHARWKKGCKTGCHVHTEEMCEKAIEKSEKKTAEKKEEEEEKSAISGKGTGIEKEKSVSEIEKAIEEAMKSVAKKKPYK